MSYRGVINRVSEEERELCEIKNAAAEFYRVNRVPEQIEGALNEFYLLKHRDVHGFLANYFANLSAPPRINRLKGRELYDTRGQLSIEVEVICIVHNKEKSVATAAVSSYFESEEPNSQERCDHVMTAVQWINEPLTNMLKDQNPCDQSGVDHILSSFFLAWYREEKDIPNSEEEESHSPSESEVILPSAPSAQAKEKKTPDKGKKSNTAEKLFPPAEPLEPVLPGSFAIGSVSLAIARAGAQLQGLPLYRHIATLKNQETPTQFHVPVSLVTLLSCGKMSPGKLNLLEEVILIPKTGQRVKQIITMTLELQKEMMRIMNTSTKAGATQATVHSSGAELSYERPEQPLDLISEACTNLGLALGTEIHLALNCAARELIDYSKGKYEVTAGVLKSPDELVDMYQSLVSKYPAIVALINPFRSEDKVHWEKLSNVFGDSCSLLFDVTYKMKALPHLGAVGLGLDYVKLGGLSGAERMTKYNRLISIEEELAQQGILVSKEKHPPPLFAENLQKQSTPAERPVSGKA